MLTSRRASCRSTGCGASTIDFSGASTKADASVACGWTTVSFWAVADGSGSSAAVGAAPDFLVTTRTGFLFGCSCPSVSSLLFFLSLGLKSDGIEKPWLKKVYRIRLRTLSEVLLKSIRIALVLCTFMMICCNGANSNRCFRRRKTFQRVRTTPLLIRRHVTCNHMCWDSTTMAEFSSSFVFSSIEATLIHFSRLCLFVSLFLILYAALGRRTPRHQE